MTFTYSDSEQPKQAWLYFSLDEQPLIILVQIFSNEIIFGMYLKDKC